jgi:cell division septal protein FtsQ
MAGAATRRSPAARRSRSGEAFAVRRGPERSRQAVIARAGAGLLTLLAVGFGLWWLLTSATFAVNRLESGAYRYTSETELQAVLSAYLGRNIWTLRPGEIAAGVEVLPWVRDLQVRRRLPDTMVIDFREWVPVLMLENVTIAGQVRDRLVLRSDGSLSDFPAHLPLPGLPVLVGAAPVRAGDEGHLHLAAEQSAQLMELISAIEDAGLEAASPVDFVVARPAGFAIVLQDGQGTLLLGREDFGPRLQRYMIARDHLEPGLDYDLRFAERITVSERH